MARGTRLSGALPVSIAVHLVAFGLLFVVPLLADMTLPPVALPLPAYVRATAVPAPPPVTRPRPGPQAPPRERALNTTAVPFAAPSSILPERDEVAAGVPTDEGGIGSGVPVDVGVVVPEATRAIDAPPIARPPATVRFADLPQPPRKTADARPVYPDIARTARVQGTVVLEAIIDRSGRVDELRVVRSVPLLDQAAVDAVRQWRYTPSTLRGQPVAVLITITINFTLQ